MIELEEHVGVSVLRLNHPPVNALGLPQIEALTKTLNEIPKQKPCVITGSTGVFSAGVDTKAFQAYTTAERAELVFSINELVATLFNHQGPLVAAINGHALGGGFVMALCADFRIAAHDIEIQLGLTEAKAGIPFPAGPLEVIRNELDPNLKRQLTLTSSTLSVDEAFSQGVIDELVHVTDVVHESLNKAQILSEQAAFSEVKQQLRFGLAQRLASIVETRTDPLASRFLRGSIPHLPNDG